MCAFRDSFCAALADDFNTPEALAQLFELIGEGNRRLETGDTVGGARASFVEMLTVLGLETLLGEDEELDPELEELLNRRESARETKDFAAADRIRDELADRGYEIRDGAEGPRLVRKQN